MGKVKTKERRGHSNHEDDPSKRKRGIVRRDYSQVNQKKKNKPLKKSTPTSQQQKLKIPFVKNDHVLLVGEGDFSFALSLAQTHNVAHIVATCYDTEQELLAKFPHVKSTITRLLQSNSTMRTPNSISIEGATPTEESEWEGLSSSEPEPPTSHTSPTPTNTTVHYSINATKLSTAHKKALRPSTPFTKIVFNFPHVGGLSTDVNRQVRANQELLVGFFNAAKSLLASATDPVVAEPATQEENDDGAYHTDDEQAFDLETGSPIPQPRQGPSVGQILVTLFEGEPYTLWNIRDLARHCGLKVVESFKFHWTAYPGYQHARTVGEITGGKEGKRGGAWRGEERDARCYALEVDGGGGVVAPGAASGGNMTVLGKREKRGRTGDDEDKDSD